MTGLMEALTRAVEGGFGLALAASFLWGVASIVLSPCHLSGIPLLVAFLSREASGGSPRPYRVASLFALGLVASVALVGAATAAVGRMAGDLGPWTNWLIAAVLALVGFALLDVLRLNFSSPNLARFQGRGARAAFLA
ncbi:MAG: cytochrome c biogenesis protein CcdA, partial [Fimbriimonadales bacterium]